MAARERGPYDALSIYIKSPGREALHRRFRVVPRRLIKLRECRCGRIRPRVDPNDGTWKSEIAGETYDGSPDGTVRWAGDHSVKCFLDPLVLGGIERLIGFYIVIPFPVSVRIHHESCPALGLFLVAGLVQHLCIDP